jgi:hypothetical protein
MAWRAQVSDEQGARSSALAMPRLSIARCVAYSVALARGLTALLLPASKPGYDVRRLSLVRKIQPTGSTPPAPTQSMRAEKDAWSESNASS